MFCKNCGKELSETAKFCTNCGATVTQDASNLNTPVEETAAPVPPVVDPYANAPIEPPYSEAPATDSYDDTPIEPPYSGAPMEPTYVDAPYTPPTSVPVPVKKPTDFKKIAIIGGVVAVVVAAIVTVIILFAGGGNDKKALSTNGYVEEVEAYLNYIAEKDDDVRGCLSDFYIGGSFGQLYSGEEAADIHELMFRDIFERQKEEAEMSYYYYDSFDYDNWRDFVKESAVESVYDGMKNTYGNWELTYEITQTRKLSDSKTENLQENWEHIIEFYEYELNDELELDSDDRKEFKDFINHIEDLKVESAYGVEVKIEIDGSKDEYSNVSEFIVAKIGKEWVILDGVSAFELTYK